jgi:hypothetical protein
MSMATPKTIEIRPQAPAGLHTWVAFGLCAGILAAVTVGSFVLGRGTFFDKGTVPLHKSLGQMDKSQLGPYQFVRATILPDEIEEALGTKEYIQWGLQDTRGSVNDPLCYPQLFVTYYTGGRTQVPHTPERCHLGVDWAIKTSWDEALEIPSLDDPSKTVKVPVRVVVFNKPGLVNVQEQTVVYTFYANCGYACSTNEIRAWLNLPWVSKSFFSKVEVTVGGESMGISKPDAKQAAAAAQGLLQTVLPVLMRDHWPRQQELRKAETPASR